MIKLNLGCGTDLRSGYINIDFRDAVVPAGIDYIKHDLNKPLPFDIYSCEEVFARDILEHFSWRDTDRIFADWVRVLNIGGVISILVPNFEVHLKNLQDGVLDWKPERSKGAWGYFVSNVFGGQDYDGNFHHTTFTPETVKELFERNSLSNIEITLEDRGIWAKAIK